MIFIAVLVLVLGAQGMIGCANPNAAYGRTVGYSAAWPTLTVSSSKTISVAVLDHRSIVLNGQKANTYVGVTRAKLGNPFDMNTLSGISLADDLAKAIVGGLSNSGLSAERASKVATDSLRAANPDSRLLVVTVADWQSDTYERTGFEYDLSAVVYSNSGEILAQHSAKDSQQSTVSLVEEARRVLSNLLSNKKIVEALR